MKFIKEIENIPGINKMMELARTAYDNGDPSHDFLHVMRVLKNAIMLSKHYATDLDLLVPSVLLHDIVFVPKNSPLRSQASKISAEKAKEVLLELNYSEEKALKIRNIIEEHSFSRGLKPTTLESQILQDADRLDALGAIGIMRNISTGVLMKSSYYHEIEPIAVTRSLDDKLYSIDHFFLKLFKLPDLMNTELAKKEALRRVEFLKLFLEEFRQNIGALEH